MKDIVLKSIRKRKKRNDVNINKCIFEYEKAITGRKIHMLYQEEKIPLIVLKRDIKRPN